MHKEILINVAPHEKRVAIFENKVLEEFYVERKDLKHFAGSIYKGRVEKVIPGMGAAFVDIGKEKNGFLYISDIIDDAALYKNVFLDGLEDVALERKAIAEERRIEAILKSGQSVLVQVVKEPIGDKGPRLTTHVAIPGRYAVLTPFDDSIGISKRIDDDRERDRIRKMLEEIGFPRDGIGCIVRTEASGTETRDLRRELDYLTKLWRRIKYRAALAMPPSCIYEEYGLILRVIRDLFTDDVNALIVDSKLEYKKINQFLNSFKPALRKKVRLHNDRTPLFEKHNLESQIESIFNKRVSLKGGGSIIIEQTESLIAIDVNTERYIGKRDLEETVFRINLKAAQEIPRQLRLRDLGGIIIIDFIDMKLKEHRKDVFETLKNALRRDKAKTNILNISPIGVVEMTRQRVRKSLESVSYKTCPYCEGRGLVKTPATVTVEAVRKMERVLASRIADRLKKAPLSVLLHPDVYDYMKSRHKEVIEPLERRFRNRIFLKSDKSLHIEDVITE